MEEVVEVVGETRSCGSEMSTLCICARTGERGDSASACSSASSSFSSASFSTAAEIDALAGTQHRVIGLVSICSVVSNTTS